MHQRLDAALDGDLPAAAGRIAALPLGARALAGAEDAALLLHLVRVVVLLEAVHAQVEVLADGAVVTVLHALLARVARVDELVLALRVEKSMIE